MTCLAGLWALLHNQLGRLADCPTVAMTEVDAKTQMQAAQNVLRHYSIKTTQKAIDYMNLASVTLYLETPRIVALVHRAKHGPPQPAAVPSPAQPAQVFQFRPPGHGAPGSEYAQAGAMNVPIMEGAPPVEGMH